MALRYPTATNYSKHFKRSELDCRCGCTTPPHIQRELRRTAINLEAFRKHLGRILYRRGLKATKGGAPVGIASAYRCPAHNKAVHGAVRSQHLTGRAVDFQVPPGMQSLYVLAASRVRAFRRGGIGVYPNGGVHADRRGWKARWSSYRGQ
jgi:uncharacterized protein YcbK (DUF882 family)